MKIFGIPDPGAVAQFERIECDDKALMADHHKGYGVPIGGVIRDADRICIAAVGFDIACGNKAVKLDVRTEHLTHRHLLDIARAIKSKVSFGVGRKNSTPLDHELFDDPAWSLVPELKELARSQLGTVGSGNHYVDVFSDGEFVWVGVHFGSRGLGHKTATQFMKLIGENPNIMDEVPKFIDADSTVGMHYLEAMRLCGRYAYAGRDWVCGVVADVIGGNVVEEVHNHHNFCWREDGAWVMRKGATPAYRGQLSFVGATMAEPSVILRGLDASEALNSTVHGAGRVMSRTQAAGKSRWVKGQKVKISEGCIDYAEVLKNIDVIVEGGGADEAPAVYKRLDEVLAFHAGQVEVVHTLKPLIVVMASDEYDPYKD